jgi:alkylation response protein AidB-like acyl-CoA dehydrogenase
MTFPILQVATGEAARGGASFRMGLPGFVAMEHAAVALGIGQRALSEICEHAGSKKRGGLAPGTVPTLLAQREAFQNGLGRALMKLRAARNLVFDVVGAAWDTACRGSVPAPLAQAEMRCAARTATEMAAEVAGMAGSFAGGSALFESNPIQRCVRDLYAASQHFVVADTGYEALGKMALGQTDANPFG